MTFLYVQCFYILFTFYGIFQQKSPHLFSNNCDILKQRLMTTLLLTGSFAKINRENPTFSPLYATNTGVSSAVLR